MIDAGMQTANAWAVITGHALEELKRLPAKSVDCVVTSPPYWSLREYPVPPTIWDAKTGCRHKWVHHVRPAANGKTNGRMVGWKAGRHAATRVPQASQFCSKCGAWCGQLGLEPTPKLYVKHLVQIFRQVKRVLKPGSPLWVNIGDTWYSRAGSGKRMGGTGDISHYRGLLEENGTYPKAPPSRMPIDGLKPKDLVGIPWMVAFALRDQVGFWLRSEVIWQKPNGIAKVADDRPANVHETIFLLANARHYYYDAAANMEPSSPSERERRLREQRQGHNAVYDLKRDHTPGQPPPGATSMLKRVDKRIELAVTGLRRRRSVWKIACTPYEGEHTSTFPPKIAEICITCGCPPGGTVLDPFCGRGTVGLVATRMGRNFIGIELSPQHAKEAKDWINSDAPLFNPPAQNTTVDDLILSGELFA
jgi:DNA modification methylase